MMTFMIGSALLALASIPGVLLVWKAAHDRRHKALRPAEAVARRRRHDQH